jgi:hypothetical protein
MPEDLMDTHMGTMDEEYEACYSDALLILAEKYDMVGVPYQTNEGKRICDIGTIAADDHAVFLLAWGADIADKIEQARQYLRAARCAIAE